MWRVIILGCALLGASWAVLFQNERLNTFLEMIPSETLHTKRGEGWSIGTDSAAANARSIRGLAEDIELSCSDGICYAQPPFFGEPGVDPNLADTSHGGDLLVFTFDCGSGDPTRASDCSRCYITDWASGFSGAQIIDQKWCNSCDYCEHEGAFDGFAFDCSNRGIPASRICPVGPGRGGICFWGENLVNVQGKGNILIKDVQIGDMVETINKEYEQVYSIGHKNLEQTVTFVQIFASALEQPLVLSKTHMLFLSRPSGIEVVAASSVKVGDKLVLASSHPGNSGDETNLSEVVTKIKSVHRKGFIAPFTPSGTIAVNGAIASIFVDHQSSKSPSDRFQIGEWKTSLSLQKFYAMTQAHHRILCMWNWDFCQNETYTREGYSTIVFYPYQMYLWLLQQNALAMTVFLIPLFPLLLFFNTVETFLNSHNPLLLLFIAIGTWVWMRRFVKKTTSKVVF